MARKPKPEARTEPGFRSVPVKGARPLVVIGPEHPGWKGIPVGADGAIVWLLPPESASDEQVDKLEADLRSVGAVAVKVERRRASQVVVEAREKRPHARARDVVLELARSANVEDRPALVGLVEKILGSVGL